MKIQNEDLGSAIQEVKAAMYVLKDLRMFKRYQAILMYLKGRTYPEIGELIGYMEQTICHYVRDYRNNGLEGLIPGQSPGRPRNLTDQQELYQVIVESRPSDVGFAAEMNWNSSLVRNWIDLSHLLPKSWGSRITSPTWFQFDS